MVSLVTHRSRSAAVGALTAGILVAGALVPAQAVEQLPAQWDDWFTTGNLSRTEVDGALCVDVPAGTSNPWDAILGFNGVPSRRGSATPSSSRRPPTPT